MLSVLGHAILLMISFIGLCAGMRKLFKLNIFIAPYFVTSGIITLLMLAGMLRILEPAFWIIYAAGFAGLIYKVSTSRQKLRSLCYPLIGAAVLFSAFLVWRFHSSTLYQNDDISHWALVARHLLRYNAFPDVNAPYVYFQSYPLGAACFIYYICKSIANTEGLYLIAQNLLFGIFYLPVLAHVHSSKRKVFYPIALAAFVFLFDFGRSMIDLRIDMLLAFMGIGICATTLYYRKDLKKALICAIPGMTAVVYTKNSGMFFAAVATVILIWIACNNTKSFKTVLTTALISIGSFVAAYLLWTLHIRFRFPAALDTKHAISLSAYAAEAASKSPETLLYITKRFLRSLLGFSRTQIKAGIFVLGCMFLLAHGCFYLQPKRRAFRTVVKSVLFCAGVYAFWSFMLYLMYIFSMPELESTHMAGFSRYNNTGLAFSMGASLIALFAFHGKEGTPLRWPVQLLRWGSSALIIALAIAICLPESITHIHPERSENYTKQRADLMRAREEYQLSDGKRFAFFCFDEDLSVGPYHEYYHIKYEFETADIIMMAENPEKAGTFLVGTREENEITTNLKPQLEAFMDGCEALLVMSDSPAFEEQLNAFLETYTGSTPVIRTYAYQ